MAEWYKEQGEYIRGAFFGLVAIDLFMFLIYCISERTTEGYGLITLLISGSFLAVSYLDKMYDDQEAEAHH